MSKERLSQDEHRRIAEQIILGQKGWGDFDFPSEDDRLHVQAIVDRGVQAIGEGQRKVKQRIKKDIDGNVSMKEFAIGYSLSEVLTEGGCTPFSIAETADEPQPLRRQHFEALTQALSELEMATLVKSEGKVLTELLSEQEEGKLERLGEEVQDIPQGLASAVSLSFFEKHKEYSPELGQYLTSYRTTLESELDVHCKKLYKLLAIDPVLNHFSESQWKRLVGLTPRDQMGAMAFALTPETLKKLKQLLPARQRSDLDEIMGWRVMERERRLETYGDSISSLKRWVGLVNKIGREG